MGIGAPARGPAVLMPDPKRLADLLEELMIERYSHYDRQAKANEPPEEGQRRLAEAHAEWKEAGEDDGEHPDPTDADA